MLRVGYDEAIISALRETQYDQPMEEEEAINYITDFLTPIRQFSHGGKTYAFRRSIMPYNARA